MKKIIALIMACVLLGGCSAMQTSHLTEIKNIKEIKSSYGDIDNTFVTTMYSNGYQNLRIYEPSELTNEILETRTEQDVLVVERCVGKVINNKGDGKILNANENFDYICYEGHLPEESEKVGTKVVTYLVYNPDTNYTDDVMERYDYVVSETQ